MYLKIALPYCRICRISNQTRSLYNYLECIFHDQTTLFLLQKKNLSHMDLWYYGNTMYLHRRHSRTTTTILVRFLDARTHISGRPDRIHLNRRNQTLNQFLCLLLTWHCVDITVK